MGLLHIRVGDFLNSDLGKLLQEKIQQHELGDPRLKLLEKQYGLKLSEVESVTLMILPHSPAFGPRIDFPGHDPFVHPHPHGEPFSLEPVVLVTTKKPYDRINLLKRIPFQNRPDGPEFFLGSGRGFAFQFVSSRSFVVGPPRALITYANLLAQESPQEEGVLQDALDLVNEKKHTVIAGYHLSPSFRHALEWEGMGRFPIGVPFYPLVTQPTVMGLDLGSSLDFEVVFLAKNPRSASLAAETAKTGLVLLNKIAKLPPELQEALSQAKVVQQGNNSSVRVSVKKDPAKILGLVSQITKKILVNKAYTDSGSNLKQIALACHAYHDSYRGFPPPFLRDKNNREGKPLLSWRVAILPYIEQQDLYEQFKLDEPWDSPHNKKLIAQMPKIYAPVGGKKTKPGLTYYQVFVGPGTAFEDLEGQRWAGVRFSQILDGTSNTLMVVEAGEPVIWTKPDDLPYDPKKPLPKLGGLFPDGFHAALCDGSVQFIPNSYKKEFLRFLVTRNDGQVIPSLPNQRSFDPEDILPWRPIEPLYKTPSENPVEKGDFELEKKPARQKDLEKSFPELKQGTQNELNLENLPEQRNEFLKDLKFFDKRFEGKKR